MCRPWRTPGEGGQLAISVTAPPAPAPRAANRGACQQVPCQTKQESVRTIGRLCGGNWIPRNGEPCQLYLVAASSPPDHRASLRSKHSEDAFERKGQWVELEQGAFSLRTSCVSCCLATNLFAAAVPFIHTSVRAPGAPGAERGQKRGAHRGGEGLGARPARSVRGPGAGTAHPPPCCYLHPSFHLQGKKTKNKTSVKHTKHLGFPWSTARGKRTGPLPAARLAPGWMVTVVNRRPRGACPLPAACQAGPGPLVWRMVPSLRWRPQRALCWVHPSV